MTRQQRDQSESDLTLETALGRFVDSPVRLPPQHVQAILNELCGAFGMCFSPQDYETIEAEPPTDPRAFAELVMKLDGLGSDDAELFLPVLRRVLSTFEGVARGKS